MNNLISMLNSIVSDIRDIELFDDDLNWIIDMIPTLSSYNCIRGYISGNKLRKLIKNSNLIDDCFYKIIIYIDDKIIYNGVNILYFDTEKHLEKNINILSKNEYSNLSTLLKTYTVLKDSIEFENLIRAKL